MSALEGTLLHLAIQVGPVLAQSDETASGGALISLLFPFLLLGGLFYFLLFRPQRKRRDQMEQLQASLEIGDEIRTVGGIYGRVKAITEGDIIIDVGNGTTLRIAPRAISTRIGADEE